MNINDLFMMADTPYQTIEEDEIIRNAILNVIGKTKEVVITSEDGETPSNIQLFLETLKDYRFQINEAKNIENDIKNNRDIWLVLDSDNYIALKF